MRLSSTLTQKTQHTDALLYARLQCRRKTNQLSDGIRIGLFILSYWTNQSHDLESCDDWTAFVT